MIQNNEFCQIGHNNQCILDADCVQSLADLQADEEQPEQQCDEFCIAEQSQHEHFRVVKDSSEIILVGQVYDHVPQQLQYS